VKYDAVIFDLLTALLDSWTLWNDVAGTSDDGLKWRRRYLEITYGSGAYRPYETLVREAACDVGLPESLGRALERRWGELAPGRSAGRAGEACGAAAYRGDQLLGTARPPGPRIARQACRSSHRDGETGFYKPRPEPYAPCWRRWVPPERTVRGRLGVRRARRQEGRHAGLLAQSRRPSARDDARPDHLEPTLDKLADLFPPA
jgi:hypothetical protein